MTARILFFLVEALAVAAVASLAGCTTDKSKVYQGEDFHATGVYSHKFEGSSVATCEAARRALLSQGYIVGEIKADLVNGQKSFQPDPETHVEIAFHVVCVSDGNDGKNSTAFVNALQDRYAIKKTPSSASLGVGAVGAVSLPFGSSDDSLVKVASETIPSGPIYDRFFGLTENYLKQIGKDFGPEPVHEKPKAEPAKPTSPDTANAAPATSPTPADAGKTDPAIEKPAPAAAPGTGAGASPQNGSAPTSGGNAVPATSTPPSASPSVAPITEDAPAMSGGRVLGPARPTQPAKELFIES